MLQGLRPRTPRSLTVVTLANLAQQVKVATLKDPSRITSRHPSGDDAIRYNPCICQAFRLQPILAALPNLRTGSSYRRFSSQTCSNTRSTPENVSFRRKPVSQARPASAAAV